MILRKTCSRLCIFLLLLICNQAFAQTSNISGVVNSYYKVEEVIPAKACLIVSDPTGLNINSLVMVLQMKGAAINTANNISFGDTTSLNGAGFYEIGTICYIIGDSVFLFHDLLNTYDVNAQVQLVQFAEYYSANVVDTVKAMPWDSATGMGGVIAIFADQDITLTKPIWADTSGYKGGAYLLSSGTCNIPGPATGFYYTATSTSPQNGAYKGESVASLLSSQTGGRGAPANGGGGGNNHNNSGGGGANLVAGGIGGGNSSTAGCTTTLRGLGGKAMDNWQGAKIFAGGGGGAGQGNNGFSSIHGGRGGGIIFIWANQLIGNNELISANGGAGGDSQSDGAGGGGAGGTIIMHVSNYSGAATIRANGGNGGNSADGGTIGRCFGGGGGGSGGAIYFTGSIPAVTVSQSGGAAGVESGRDPSCAAAQAAGAGSNGSNFSNYTFRRSTAPAGYCQLLLPTGLLYFRARLQNNQVLLDWETDHPEQVASFIPERRKPDGSWEPLMTITAMHNRNKYSAIDLHPAEGSNFYRLKILETNGPPAYSEVKKVDFRSDAFRFHPNPARNSLVLYGQFEAASPVQLTDMNGRILLERKVSGTRIPISLPNLQPGIYLIRYRNQVSKLMIL